jgi:hypothetical protein
MDSIITSSRTFRLIFPLDLFRDLKNLRVWQIHIPIVEAQSVILEWKKKIGNGNYDFMEGIAIADKAITYDLNSLNILKE